MNYASLLNPIKRTALKAASTVADKTRDIYEDATKPNYQAVQPKLGNPVQASPVAITSPTPKAVTLPQPKYSAVQPKLGAPTQGSVAVSSLPPMGVKQNAYEMKRQQVQEDARRQSDARKEALKQRLAASGIQDSGIAMGQERTIETEDAMQAARSMRDIDIEELQSGERKDEAQKQRDWQSGENTQDRDIQKQSLAQSKELAEKGLSLQQAQLELQRQGMSDENARYYAGLGQAKYLAERGLDQNQVSLELQRRGLEQQQAQFFSTQAFQREMVGSERTWKTNALVATELIANLDPTNPKYQADLQSILQQLNSDSPDYGSLNLGSLKQVGVDRGPREPADSRVDDPFGNDNLKIPLGGGRSIDIDLSGIADWVKLDELPGDMPDFGDLGELGKTSGSYLGGKASDAGSFLGRSAKKGFRALNPF